MLIKSHSVRAKTKITENNSFVKECKCDAQFLYKRYIDFYNHISDIKDLFTPKIIRVTDKNHIEFEFVDLWLSLREIVESGDYSDELFLKIWTKLGELHLKINQWVISDNWNICWDFCTWNIFLNWEDLYFIDFEPPFRILEWNTNNKQFLTSNSYIEDISQFLFRLDNILIPKKPFLFFKSFESEKQSFIKGYSEATNIKIPIEKIQKRIRLIAKNEISFERNFQNTITFWITKIIYKCKYKI